MSRLFYIEVPSFYAAVERQARPQLAKTPIIVGGDPRKGGLVQAASSEALAASIEPGMRMDEALRRCPRAQAVKTDMPRYRQAAEALQRCLWQVVAELEQESLAAYYFDATTLTRSDWCTASPKEAARRLQELVRGELDYTLSIGIASAKFLAKLAAQDAGAGGIRVVAEGSEQSYLAPLPVGRLPGVGPKTVEKLRTQLDVDSVGDLLEVDPRRLEAELGNHGLRSLEYARGRDDSPLRAAGHPKSLSQEHTFAEVQLDAESIWERLRSLALALEEKLARQRLRASRVAIKIGFADQTTQNRSRTLQREVTSADALYSISVKLLERTAVGVRPVRRLGLIVSKLTRESAEDRQLELF